MAMLNLMKGVAQASGVVAVVAWAAQESLYNVDGGERAVIFDRINGVRSEVVPPGTHFKIPWIEYPFIYEVRAKPRVINTTTGTKDLQMVNISLRVLSRPIPEELFAIHKEIGIDYDDKILPSIAPEILKASVAQYNADQLLTQREMVSRDIRDTLIERAEAFHLLLDDVSITHLTFGKEFEQAIEHKQVAQQEAERSKFVVAKAEQEKLATIIRAEGESESAQLITSAMEQYGDAYLSVRRIDTAKEIADTLARSRNVTYLPSGGNMLLGLSA
jgi:prohibitin 1